MVLLTMYAKQPTIIHSNKKNIVMMIDKGRNDWTISPELFPYSMQPFNEGIVPDIIVDYTLDEYLNQTVDKDVATAIDLLSNQISNLHKCILQTEELCI